MVYNQVIINLWRVYIKWLHCDTGAISINLLFLSSSVLNIKRSRFQSSYSKLSWPPWSYANFSPSLFCCLICSLSLWVWLRLSNPHIVAGIWLKLVFFMKMPRRNITLCCLCPCVGANGNLFREYIGAMGNGVKLSDVPINPAVEVHFILSFAIDYTTGSGSPFSTNRKFNIFWDTGSLTPQAVQAIKARHNNVKVALSLGGDSVGNGHPVQFKPSSVSSWVNNAVSSLSKIIKQYHLDGIDIDYEHFEADANTFVECIRQLITKLK